MRKNFSVKLWAINTALLFAVLFVIFSFIIVVYVHAKEREYTADMQNELRGIERNILNQIELLKTVSLQTGTNDFLAGKLNAARQSPDLFDIDTEAKTEVYKILWPYILEREKVSRISAYNDEGTFVYVGEAVDEQESVSYREHSYIPEAFKQKQEAADWFCLDADRISVVRKIKTSPIFGMETVGYIEAELALGLWEKQLFGDDTSTDGYIVYNTGTKPPLFFHQIPKTVMNGLTDEDLLDEERVEEQYREQYYIQDVTVEEYGIGILALRNKKEQRELIVFFVLYATLILVILAIVLAVLQKKISSHLTQPLLALCETARNTKLEKEVLDSVPKCDDEFQVISDAFQEMMKSLHESMEQNVAIKTAEVKANMFALQAQMNPHFIHNTLSIIQAYAGEENYRTVIEICEHLSDMIRYSNEFTDQSVYLEDEIEHVGNYMRLVKMRYENGVEYELENYIPEGSIKVPRFILQPVIENSLSHGLQTKEFPWNIRITCVWGREKWFVKVYDNGIGFTSEEIEQINAFKKELMSGDKEIINHNLKVGGLSIRNIMTRLYLEYKEEMIFKVVSEKDKFSVIYLGGGIKM